MLSSTRTVCLRILLVGTGLCSCNRSAPPREPAAATATSAPAAPSAPVPLHAPMSRSELPTTDGQIAMANLVGSLHTSEGLVKARGYDPSAMATVVLTNRRESLAFTEFAMPTPEYEPEALPMLGVVGTLLGAVGGAIAGNIFDGQQAGGRGIEVVVQRDDGQNVTIAQRDDGDVQLGDRVQIVQDGRGVARAVRDTSRTPD